MPVDLRITGTGQLRALGLRFKAEGESGKGFRRELLKEIRAEAKPAAEAAKAAILAMPNEAPEDTGLRRRIAANIKVRTRLSGKHPGVKITVAKLDGTNLPRRINKGSWRHPVFGTDTWVEQTGHRGWFDDTLRRQAPIVGRGVRRAMRTSARRLGRG